jgi:type I restriction enzyme S subunit
MGRETPVIGLSRLKPYSTYKDSGVEWLGDIPAHWETAPVRFLSRRGHKTFTDGDWIESPFIRNEGIRLIQTGNIGIGAFKEQGFRYIDEETFRAFGCTEIMPGDVLICRLADPVGRACLAPDLGVRMITSVDVCILKPDNNVDAAFLVYALSGEEYLSWMASICRGGTRDRVSRSMLGSNLIQKPPYEEQRAISAFLDRETAKIDALIEKKERLIELLQEKRTALITQAVTRGLDPAVPMKDSGVEWLGEIPAHWVVESNKRLFKDSNIRSDYGDEELLTVSHLTGVTWHSEKNVTMIEPESYEDYKICRAGELAINTMWAWMGALGIAKENGIVSPSYNVYALRTSSLDPRYYDYLCRTPLHIAELTRYSKGIWKSRLRLYPDGFYEISTPLPPITEQEQIADFVDSAVLKVDAMVMATRKAVDRLREYRTALISAAVTGKIDVREA